MQDGVVTCCRCDGEPDEGYNAKAAEWRAKLPDEVISNEQDD